MNRDKFIKEINKRLPDGLIIKDETNFDFTESEIVSVFCWIKYFNNHYKKHKYNKLPHIIFPIISKRVRLDFGLYHIPCELQEDFGKHIIYISSNLYSKKERTLKNFISVWNL